MDAIFLSNHGEALYVRDRNEDLAPLRFLFHDLRIDKWWFEIGDMVRKQLLIVGN